MKTLLKKHFGFDSFRPMQGAAIEHVLAGGDAFVLMPTGGGKSLCFQLPALKLPGLTLVVSPLIALMKDQVDTLKANGIAAEYINSTLPPGQISDIYQRALAGGIKLLYVAPERFPVPDFQEFLKSARISLIAVDEAHCISEWGHDFRPEYRNLYMLKTFFSGVPIIALTATATPKVREDIVRHLRLNKPREFVSSFNRENLHLSVVEKKNAFSKLVNLLEAYRKESVIIYCFSRKDTETIAADLRANGFNARAYHAGLKKEERAAAQDQFVKDAVNIIVATIAFGMGIDKPDVRLVVHYTFPKTLEGYYQEIGRAGRDSLPSECVMFYTYADARKHEFFIDKLEDGAMREKAYDKLDEVMRYADTTACRKKYILNYFGEDLDENCASCDACTGERERIDATEVARKVISAILRTDSRFGRNYVVDVLMGKNIQKIRVNKHDRLSVFGIAKDWDEDALGQIIKQMTDRGFLRKSEGQYPTLSLARKGADWLKAGDKLELVKPETKLKPSKSAKKGELDYDEGLFEELRALRQKLALEANVPPFVVFGDVALREMAYYLPQSRGDFSQISGVGAKKLEKYADVFLESITQYTRDNSLEPRKIGRLSRVISGVRQVYKTRFNAKTKELLDKQTPLERIAKNQKITVGSAINHIEKLVDAGQDLDLDYLKLPLDRFSEISAAFTACGDARLKPVFEYLDGKHSYDQLRLARVLLRAEDNT